MAIIKLKSSDNEVFEVDDSIARMSVTLKTMLDDLGVQENDSDPVPIQNVPAAILKLVIKWAEHHKDDPAPNYENEDREAQVTTWFLFLFLFDLKSYIPVVSSFLFLFGIRSKILVLLIQIFSKVIAIDLKFCYIK